MFAQINKCLILIFLILLIDFYCYSQDYNILPSGQTSFFEDSKNEIYGLQIDSVTNQNYPDARFGDNYSWSGKRIIQESDYFLFVNIEDDTITIKPYSALNESWLCYANSSGLNIMATISEIELFNFLNVSDSAKVIDFQAVNSSGDSIDHIINSHQVIISKNYGVLKWFNLFQFPNLSILYQRPYDNSSLFEIESIDSIHFDQLELVGIETTTEVKGIGTITYKELYNFDVLDNFT